VIVTFAFGVNRDWPSVTICMPSRSPPATMISWPAVRSTTMGCVFAVPLSVMT
jgi:hypothetical protein